MSGGSLDYLCSKGNADELLQYHNIENMEIVEQTLLERGYNDIAKDVRRLIEYCLSAANRIETLAEMLNNVFYAVEWWKSGDIGDESLKEALEKYRRGETNEQ